MHSANDIQSFYLACVASIIRVVAFSVGHLSVCYFDLLLWGKYRFVRICLFSNRTHAWHQEAAIFTLMWTELNRTNHGLTLQKTTCHVPPYMPSTTVRHMSTCKCRTNNAQCAILCACAWREIATCKYNIVLIMLVFANKTCIPYTTCVSMCVNVNMLYMCKCRFESMHICTY